MQDHDAPPWWRTRTGLVFLGFSAIAAYFLITEHRAHLALAVPYLPWLLLAACPLMHLSSCITVTVDTAKADRTLTERKGRISINGNKREPQP